MTEDRWLKNAESVRKICEKMGYRLISFDPDWSISEITNEPQKCVLQAMTDDALGRNILISDDFMGRIALMMGLDWTFLQTDDEIIDSIQYIKNLKKGSISRQEMWQNVFKDKKMINEDEIFETEIKGCDNKIRSLECILNIRQNLKEMFTKKRV